MTVPRKRSDTATKKLKKMSIVKHFILLSFCAILMAPALCLADGAWSFMHIDGNMGLSSNNVKSLAEDSYGFLWIGTTNGLNRYDGHSLRQLTCFDYDKRQGNNNINALYEDRSRNLWVGTDRGVYVYSPRSDRFSLVDVKDSKHRQSADNWVQAIIGDRQGGVWVLLPDVGVFRYSGTERVSFFKLTPAGKFKKTFPSCIFCDSEGRVWVGTTGAGLYLYNSHTGQFAAVGGPGGAALRGISLSAMSEDASGDILLASSDCHLYRYTPKTGVLSPIRHQAEGGIYVSCMTCTDGEVWVGSSRDGILVVNIASGDTRLLRENPIDRFSLSSNIIHTLCLTRNGDMAVGTLYGGVDLLLRNKFHFDKFGIASGLSSPWVRGLAQDGYGNIWVGTEDNGLNLFDPATRAISRVASPQKTVTSLTESEGNIYAGFQRGGMYVFTSPVAARSLTAGLSGTYNGTYAYLMDSRGNEWVGLGYALYRRRPGAKAFEHVTATGYDWIFAIRETHDGTVWFGTMGNGLWRYTPTSGAFKCYVYSEEAPTGLRSNSISALFEDSQGNLWVSTDRGGISRYNKAADNFTSFGTREGLPDDVAYSMLEDQGGNLWFGTNKGLVKFNPRTARCKVFTVRDGLPTNQFSYSSAIKAADRLFYFGTIDGIIAFDPKAEAAQSGKPDIYFTRLSILNKEVTPLTANSPLKDNILFTGKIVLPYDVGAFSIDVASPGFGATGSMSYSYRLLPDDDEWIGIDNNRVSFANMKPGHYRLVVRVDNFGQSSQKELAIVITPPWWSTWWAELIYCLMVAAAVWGCFVVYRNRKAREMRDGQRLFAINKEKELYENKVNFFTEVAHEIRTPLTLIEAPLEAIEETGVKDAKVRQYLKVMRQNTKRLLNLTGQLLDFQKIGANRLVLKRANVDIAALVRETVDRFRPAMTLKGKNLTCDISNEEIITSTDEEAVTKILSNLLNNAMKYGKREVRISVADGDGTAKVSVFSDGKRIEGDERRRIFEPFYQADQSQSGENGVGIGLPLSASLAGLLGGSLTLAESGAEGNTFVLILPIDKQGVKANNAKATKAVDFVVEEESNQSRNTASGCTVLIVEDNDNMRQFLAEQVRQSFAVETAANGKEALRVLQRVGVDMVVTDVMMPEMDGFELCKAIKHDVNLSHIPVVFITAKNDLDSKVRGLEAGAEAYIEKPFSIKYFRQLIRSIMENRRREREFFSKKPFYGVTDMHVNKADEEFMNKVVKTIEDNIEDENFNVESMAGLFFMSHSSLLRKIKTVFNLSPVELIRTVRLKRAAELIREGKYRIGDICFMVGITSPSYFSKLFFKQFGVTPKDFEKQCKEKKE